MEQNEGFWEKNGTYLVIGVLVVAAIVIAIANRSNNKDRENQNQNGQQNVSQSQGGSINGATSTPSSSQQGQNQSASGTPAQGNVSAVGMLMESDNKAKGNLMVDSNKGKIYVQTVREFTTLVGKQVTLQAEGDINSFKFLGFSEELAASAPQQQPSGGSLESGTGAVKFSGVLNQSTDLSKGNYTIVSGNTTVYLKTTHDYNAWLGSSVNLTADGTINSFTGAVLTK